LQNHPDGRRRPPRSAHDARPDVVRFPRGAADRHRRPGAHPFTLADRIRRVARDRGPRPDLAALIASGWPWRAGRLVAPARLSSVTVVALVLFASIVSVAPASGIRPSGGTSAGPRLEVGGGVLGPDPTGPATPTGGLSFVPVLEVTPLPADELGYGAPPGRGPADPRIADWHAHLTTYRVVSGDTVYTIAARHHLSVRTVMLANGLTSTLLHVGQRLALPSTDTVIVTVAAGDTLTSLARRLGVRPETIAANNQLIDGDLVPGQVLVIEGGATLTPSAAGPTPTVTKKRKTTTGQSRAATVRFAWPVPGGRISQRYGCTGLAVEPPYGSCRHFHAGIDISAPTGTSIVAAAAGTVAFAGWASNGGGYQVWVSFRPGMYTLYAHMSSIAVRKGAHVRRGQRIGRVGMTGNATGPHLHFEVWVGQVLGSGHPVNPSGYM
jgi:murein DD-endopeptidase MepM/ murein hydrolase activator NlpD